MIGSAIYKADDVDQAIDTIHADIVNGLTRRATEGLTVYDALQKAN